MRETIARILGDTLEEMVSGLDVQRVKILPGKAILSGTVTGSLPDLPERL